MFEYRTKTCESCGNDFIVSRSSRRTMCDACKKEKKRQDIRKHHKKYHMHDTRYSRVCHDCGKPTSNYRCPTCLDKWKRKNGVAG